MQNQKLILFNDSKYSIARNDFFHKLWKYLMLRVFVVEQLTLLLIKYGKIRENAGSNLKDKSWSQKLHCAKASRELCMIPQWESLFKSPWFLPDKSSITLTKKKTELSVLVPASSVNVQLSFLRIH